MGIPFNNMVNSCARLAPSAAHARRERIQRWWDAAPGRYELVTSPGVLDELAGSIPERGAKRLALVRDLPLLPVESAIAEIVQEYIRHKLMPADPGGDALHLALTSLELPRFSSAVVCDATRTSVRRIAHEPGTKGEAYVKRDWGLDCTASTA